MIFKKIRHIDFTISLLGIIFLSPIFLSIFIIGLFDTGSPIFIQTRVGKNKKPFKLIKFRTMSITTKNVATHLSDSSSVTPIGKILRKTKLDELPQLINVLMGDMSLVGPRPNLFNQYELINERSKRNVYSVLPGITGLAQIQKIDMSTPKILAETDEKMINSLSIETYISLIVKTMIGKGMGDRIKY